MQANIKTWMLLLLAGLLVVTVSCTNDSLDDGDSADVVLEVTIFDAPSVTASLNQMTMVCRFTITKWGVTFENLPKNGVVNEATPFNDIQMQDVTITYNWINPGNSTPTRTFGLGNVAVPVNGRVQAMFTPIAFDDLTVGLSGSTANLDMTFRGQTVEGTTIFYTTSKQLNVEACL